MNCSNCKTPLSINARFCGVCGQAVEVLAAQRISRATTSAAVDASPGWQAAPWSVAAVLNRIKYILLAPKTEWSKVAVEPSSIAHLFIGYAVPLTAWAALMSLLRLTVIGTRLPFGSLVRTPLADGLGLAAWTFLASFIGLFLVASIVNLLAPTFGGTRSQTEALKVAAYSLTPAYVGSVLGLSPVLPSLLQFTVLCYGLYVLYLGLPIVMRSRRENALGYTATVVICTFLLGIVFALAAGALGIFTHSAGLMRNSAAANAAAADQSAAILGNGVGDILGTDSKGKAGITAAVANLVKAGDQGSAPATAPTNNPSTPDASVSGDSANSAPNASAAVGGLLGALGGALGGDHPKQVVDFKSLTALLPTDLPGMKRTDARGEWQGAIGVKTASATGIYLGPSGTIHLEISDMTALSGLMGMAGALVQDSTSESDSGFERDRTIGGRSVHEKYDAASKHGELSVLVAQRYQVEVSGDGLDMNMLEQALSHIDLARLESMKDQGSPPR